MLYVVVGTRNERVKPRLTTIRLDNARIYSNPQKTSVRLEDYIPRSDSLTPYEVLEKLDCGTNGLVTDEFVRYDPNKPEDWQLGDVDNCELNRHRRLSIEVRSNRSSMYTHIYV